MIERLRHRFGCVTVVVVERSFRSRNFHKEQWKTALGGRWRVLAVREPDCRVRAALGRSCAALLALNYPQPAQIIRPAYGMRDIRPLAALVFHEAIGFLATALGIGVEACRVAGLDCAIGWGFEGEDHAAFSADFRGDPVLVNDA